MPAPTSPAALTSTASPLQEVERAVQERAKAVSLDMASPEAAARLRALVDDEVARWSGEYNEACEPSTSPSRDGAERAYRNVAGYGPLEPLLADDDVWAIMVNGPDATFDESPDTAPRSLSAGLDGHTEIKRADGRRRLEWAIPLTYSSRCGWRREAQKQGGPDDH